MNRVLYIISIVALTILIITGCSSSPTPTQTTTNATTNPVTSSEGIVAVAKQDLSQRTGINFEYINTLYLRVVRWPDTSLGCPEEGKEYAQVVTPGYQILLEANGVVYEYHTDSTEMIITCAEAPIDEVEMPEQEANVEDGGPNQPIGNNVIITKTLEKDSDTNLVDGWPNQPIGTDVVINLPTK